MKLPRPKVGVGVIIRKDGTVLLGKRKGAHGAGDWSFPGGHLEYHESPEQACIREVAEETGLRIKNIKQLAFTNDIFPGKDMHYMTLYLVADYDSGNVELREPEKCESWEWFTWDNLPQPRFLSVDHFLEQGINPFDT